MGVGTEDIAGETDKVVGGVAAIEVDPSCGKLAGETDKVVAG